MLRRACAGEQHPVSSMSPAAAMPACSMVSQLKATTITMAARMPKAHRLRSWRLGVESSTALTR